jgi:hypothetical protein
MEYAVYNVASLGFAAVHDPVRDAYDAGKVSGSTYITHGIGGGLAVAGVGIATAGVGGEIVGGTTTIGARIIGAAAVGAASGAATDATTQGVHISAGIQSEYDVTRTEKAALTGVFVGGGSAALVEGASSVTQTLANRAAQRAADQGTQAHIVENPAGSAPVAQLNSADLTEQLEPNAAESTAAMRKRVMANIADSAAARTSSRFDVHVDRANKELFSFYRTAVEDLDVSTAPNTAAFYSGPGNRVRAEQFAKDNGGTTLEQTPGGSWLDQRLLFGANSPLSPQQATLLWGRLSQRYAEGASGVVFGFVRGARPRRTFNAVEYPELLENPKVTNVITGGQ